MDAGKARGSTPIFYRTNGYESGGHGGLSLQKSPLAPFEKGGSGRVAADIFCVSLMARPRQGRVCLPASPGARLDGRPGGHPPLMILSKVGKQQNKFRAVWRPFVAKTRGREHRNYDG